MKTTFLKQSIIVLILGCTTIALTSLVNTPFTRYDKMLQATGRILTQVHYTPKQIDDHFSASVFDGFLRQLDPDKDFFLESDIKELEKYKYRIDDELRGETISFFTDAMQLFKQRALTIQSNMAQLTMAPFDFSKDEVIVVNAADKKNVKTLTEQIQKWKLRAKFLALQRYVELLERNKQDAVAKPDIEVNAEQEARKYAAVVIKRYLDRLLDSKATDRYFSSFMNTITNSFDPHTSFFMPIEKRAWDEDITGKFYGIGALIGENNGQIIISTVTPGGAAWKSGEVNNGDGILKVGEETGELVDIAGYEISDAVKLIRGNKGTSVKLMLKKADGSVRTVTIPRQALKLEETFARSSILKKEGKKFGYIYLPKFYTNYDGNDGASCAKDVATEIEKLKKDTIAGLIIDLRDNGGGSLYEVVKMVGLFIPEGPVVQVKGKDDAPQVLEDRDGTVLYDGPLEVMVNEFSASASEIFAAAIQDYQRGIITGSSSTYGKGTVQRPIPVNAVFVNPTEELGTIHVTFQKYYRINGNTTQLKGVTPDIILPGYYEFYNVMEKDNPTALAFDYLPKANYAPFKGYATNFSEVAKLYNKQAVSTAVFEQIRVNAKWMAVETKKPVSLQLEKYKANIKEVREKSRTTRNLLRLSDSLMVENNTVNTNLFKSNKEMQERANRFINDTKRDRYVSEALDIIAIMSRKSQTYMAQVLKKN